jgi:hypothetical protein
MTHIIGHDRCQTLLLPESLEFSDGLLEFCTAAFAQSQSVAARRRLDPHPSPTMTAGKRRTSAQ